jgi:cysteinyl-tRNA synthetase
MDAGEFLNGNAPGAFEFLTRFDSVFDVLKPSSTTDGLSDADIEAKVAERNAAKKSKDFARADQVRKDLAAVGIILEDTKEGVRWKRS